MICESFVLILDDIVLAADGLSACAGYSHTCALFPSTQILASVNPAASDNEAFQMVYELSCARNTYDLE